jgi:dihydroflavonol-4-reductase
VIAVTGATGFIGRHLTRALVDRGDAVHAIVRDHPRRAATPLDPRVTVVHAQLEHNALADAFRGVAVVVHLAGVVSTVQDDEYVAVNAEGTRAVAAAALANGARLVYISSLAAAGPASASAPRSEDDPPSPINAYGRTKLEGERAIAAMPGLHATTLRPGIVYGSGDRALRPLFDLAELGVMPIVGREDAAYSMIHVSDLVRAIVAAVDRGAAGDTMFAAHPQPVTTRELIEGVKRAAGSGAILLPVPMTLLRCLAVLGDAGGTMTGKPWPMNSRRYDEMAADGFVCTVDRLRDHLGIVAGLDLDAGLRETAEWIRTARRR